MKVGRNGDTRGEIKPPSPVSRVPRCNLPGKSLLGRNTGKYRKCPGDTLGRGTFDSTRRKKQPSWREEEEEEEEEKVFRGGRAMEIFDTRDERHQ